ncbi:MAG: hypothetical protein HGGPFJEG_02484 [Ignavibacteria bacterium]|nr:hypothetical protein [Ignavibacteria bacterium]
MSEEYKYNKMISRFYDVVYDKILDKSGKKFYLDEISRTKGSVLEIGSGTGRIFVPALKNGADIYGIDISDHMTGVLKKKIPEKDHFRIQSANVTDFATEKKYSLIIAPFRIFSHLLTTKDQLKALNNIFHHLKKDGRFIFDVFIPKYTLMKEDIREETDFEGEYEPGKKLIRHTVMKYRNIEQIIEITFRFIYDEDGERKTDECIFPLRYYFRYELEHLLYISRFKDVSIYGDFFKNPLSKDSKDFVIDCKK